MRCAVEYRRRVCRNLQGFLYAENAKEELTSQSGIRSNCLTRQSSKGHDHRE